MALFEFRKKKKEFPELPGLPPLPPMPPLPPEFQQPPMPQAAALPPAPQVIAQLQAQGMAPAEIAKMLRERGYPSTDILAGMQVQQPFGFPQLPPIPPAPPPPLKPVMGPSKEDVVTLLTEDIQEIAETIIEEKWSQQRKDFAKLEKWKEDVDEKLVHLEESAIALQQRMDGLEKAIFGKIEEYGKGISDVSTELKAMQRVFSTVMPQFTTNIKELQALLEGAKKKKK